MIEDNDKWKVDEIPDDSSSNLRDDFVRKTPSNSDAPIKDTREIKVNSISGPAVMFIGPRSSGKTTALLRLARYLQKKQSCTVDVNKNFRADSGYKSAVNFFLDSIQNEDWAPTKNLPLDFLCVNVTQQAKLLCQFIEAPGEHYFDDKNPHEETFQPYLTQIFNNRNINKTMVFFFWDGMLLGQSPAAYSLRLSKFLKKLDRKLDDVIIVYNKIDSNPELYDGIMPNLKSVKNKLFSDDNYSTFFNTLKDLRLQTQYVAFSSGDFQLIDKTKQRCVESIEDFPRGLYKAIKFSLTPSWNNKTKRIGK